MSHGPTLIYDKSLLQSLNKQEARWLGHHFRAVLTPIFLIEVLGDLKKAPRGDRTPEMIVGGLAANVEALGTLPNVNHQELLIHDLLGRPVAMRRVPVVAGGQPIRDRTGKSGLFFDEPPEMEALRRWRDGDFDGMEHALASQWRQAVAEIDLEAAYRNLKFVRSSTRNMRTLDDLAKTAIALTGNEGQNYRVITAAMELLQVPEGIQSAILRRWRSMKYPSLRDFAPYAAYVFSVEVFFLLGIGAELILRGRKAKTRVDVAYLYYLPFCMAFTSSDNFHRDAAPLFMGKTQRFIHGPALKADLAKLCLHYESLPEEVRRQGSMRYAGYPPLDGDFLISRLHDELLPGWRTHAEAPITITPEMNAKLMNELRPMLDAIEAAERKQKY